MPMYEPCRPTKARCLVMPPEEPVGLGYHREWPPFRVIRSGDEEHGVNLRLCNRGLMSFQQGLDKA